MTDLYEPQAEFLTWVMSGDASLVGSSFAETNLRRVLALMHDEHTANRDWATFILAHEEIDNKEVRDALLAAAKDSDPIVRGEALVGLALRDKELALPLVKRELEGKEWGSPTFEAAELIAHSSLLDGLRRLAGSANTDWANEEIAQAISACEADFAANK